MHRGTTGGSLGGREISPAKARARRQALAKQDKRWAAKSSDTTVTYPDGRVEIIRNKKR
jgi:hypothetical protein